MPSTWPSTVFSLPAAASSPAAWNTTPSCAPCAISKSVGVQVVVVPSASDGSLDPEAFRNALTPATHELLVRFAPGTQDYISSKFRPRARVWDVHDPSAHPEIARYMGTSFASRLLRKLDGARPPAARRWYQNDLYNYDPAFPELTSCVLLKGYWQSFKYFHHLRESVVAEFEYRHPLSAAAVEVERRISSCETPVGVHVRRKDYLTSGWPVLENEYYERALGCLQEKRTLSNPEFFIFSDDPAWCEEHMFPRRRKTVVSALGTSAVEEMMLMGKCDHLLIGNSTFSWWAAYLSADAQTVVAPYRWIYYDQPGFRHEDLYLPEWIVRT